MEYQTRGMEAQAESIYRSILSEAPSYPDALHLLGVRNYGAVVKHSSTLLIFCICNEVSVVFLFFPMIQVIYYQKGDPQAAIPYIERALEGNKSYEGFHNSLGEDERERNGVAE